MVSSKGARWRHRRVALGCCAALSLAAPPRLPAAASAPAQPPPAAASYLAYTGVASRRHADAFLYGEHHVLEFRGERLAARVVLYTCRDGRAFARKTVSYLDPLVPDFALEDATNGLREGIRTHEGMRRVYFRRPGEAEKSAPLPGAPSMSAPPLSAPPLSATPLVADAGFDEFVRAAWPQLMAGQVVALRFLVPSRLKDYAFQVQRLGDRVIDGVPASMFRLKLSGLWGWILPGIDVAYGTRDRQLLHYDGLSDLRDAAGDNLQVQIAFAPAARRRVDARAFELALQAHLARCDSVD